MATSLLTDSWVGIIVLRMVLAHQWIRSSVVQNGPHCFCRTMPWVSFAEYLLGFNGSWNMDFCYQNQDVHTIRMDSLLNAPIESTPILFCARVPLAGRASGLTPAYVVTITKSCHWNVIQCTSQVGCTLLRLEEKKNLRHWISARFQSLHALQLICLRVPGNRSEPSLNYSTEDKFTRCTV